MTVVELAPVSAAAGVAVIEVGRALPALADVPALGARCLVRLGGRPLGVVDVAGPCTSLDAGSLASAIEAALGPALPGPLTAGGFDAAQPMVAGEVAETVTVVIATRDRPDTLARCLESLLSARPMPAAIVVVDNAPSDRRTLELVERVHGDDRRITYVTEPRPGLGRAHNAALPHVATEHVAFTDDDVIVDTGWVGAIADGFRAADDVACVTGLIAPAELRTEEQWWVERAAGFAKGFDRRIRSARDAAGEGPLFPYDAGTLGSGANMAFTTAFLRSLGGFDPALGTGTVALGGDDLAALHAVVARGHSLVYEPAAVVFHRHHAERAALERQAYGYGAGLTAYLCSVVAHRPATVFAIGSRVIAGIGQVLKPTSPLNARRPADYPSSLVWRERAGMAAGPVRYVRQRFLDRRTDRRLGKQVA
ncbi:MAG: pgaC 1 [Acidimicrobiales bacterium]|nr:pgaC 1 [Acidimicrobiales bacterium]